MHDPTSCHEFASHFGLAFFYAKNTQNLGVPGRQCQCLFQWPATSYCHQRSGPSRLAGTDPSNTDTATAVCVCGWCVCPRSRGCVRTRVRPSVRPFVRACMRA